MGPLPVVVAHPSLQAEERRYAPTPGPVFVFLYPALPRAFKNIETLGMATQILAAREVKGFEVRLTLDGTENRYARWLQRKFGATQQVRFIGRQTKDEMASQYLPITEGKAQRRPLLVADLPYARETVGTYDLVSFFPVESADALANLMQSMIEGAWTPTGNHRCDPEAPFAPNWASLWAILIGGLQFAPQTGGMKAT